MCAADPLHLGMHASPSMHGPRSRPIQSSAQVIGRDCAGRALALSEATLHSRMRADWRRILSVNHEYGEAYLWIRNCPNGTRPAAPSSFNGRGAGGPAGTVT